MKRFNGNGKRLLIGAAVLLLLFICIVPAAMGMAMRGRMMRGQFDGNRPGMTHFHDGRNVERSTVEADGAAVAGQAPDSRAQQPRGENDGRFDHHSHRQHGPQFGRSGRGGFSPIRGIFGFLGGIIRLMGVGLLIAAAVVLFKRDGRDGATVSAADEPDDGSDAGPEMTEAEIRAAMKRLGITKIEL
ncbi:MAG: hypothetical protein KDE51_03725 [Anaerolineales bacterium]|nr:hypothetical protein [Anaerolineales bacterium]